jgi:hypothetical protein
MTIIFKNKENFIKVCMVILRLFRYDPQLLMRGQKYIIIIKTPASRRSRMLMPGIGGLGEVCTVSRNTHPTFLSCPKKCSLLFKEAFFGEGERGLKP